MKYLVLILVVVEDGLVHKYEPPKCYGNHQVLILVVVEDGLVRKKARFSTFDFTMS